MMDPGKLIDFHATFANLMDALLTLFRISTSDNWSELMMAAVRQPGRRGEESDVAVATELLQRYNSTGDVYHLIRVLPSPKSHHHFTELLSPWHPDVRMEFPACTSATPL